jgi:hypothetical protein
MFYLSELVVEGGALQKLIRTQSMSIQRILNLLSTSRLFWITFVCALIVFCQLQFWKLPSARDRANWDYFSQVIARGGMPYRDVVNIKTPLSAYIGAAAIAVTRPFGLSAVMATRTASILMAVLAIAFTFLTATLFFHSRRIGVLAATILCGIFLFGRLSADGIQPKTPMILFGLISLCCVIRDRPLLAGLFGMLSALSWQPGLLFVGTAGVAFTRYFTTWRNLKWLRVIIGAGIPLFIFLAHLLIGGALRDFYLWCLKFNVEVYGPRDYSTYDNFVERFTMLREKYYREDRRYFQLAAGGGLLLIATEIYFATKRGWSELRDRAPQHQVFIAAVVYLIFCRIDLQGEQDLIPLLPFIAIFSSVLLIRFVDFIANLIKKIDPRISALRLELAGAALLLLVVFIVNVRPVFSFTVRKKNLTRQRAEAAQIVSLLQPGDQMWVHGGTELLVVTELTNSHKYTNLDHGKDNYLDRVEPGGFEGWFEKLKSDRPRVVVFTRPKNVDRKKDFMDWLKNDYERREGDVFSYYVRKE